MVREFVCGPQTARSVMRIVEDGPGAVVDALAQRPCDGPVAIIADQAVVALAGRFASALQRAGVDARLCTMVADERLKSVATVHALAAQLLTHGVTRGGVVVAVGGGIVGDVAGFLAATYMRGVRCIQVPTTLLAMVDASIGGKTAVNVELKDGSLAKNALGVFAMPELVVCDPAALATLPPREVLCGLAECIKHGMLADPALGPWIQSHAMDIVGKDQAVIGELVARAAAVKVAIVDRDPTERGERALLNLGHTYAHALEARHADALKHGEAVALGLLAATGAAQAVGRVDAQRLASLRALLGAIGLPTRLGEIVATPDPASTLRRSMQLDKKRAGDGLVLVLPKEAVGAEVVVSPPESAVMAGWSAIGA